MSRIVERKKAEKGECRVVFVKVVVQDVYDKFQSVGSIPTFVLRGDGSRPVDARPQACCSICCLGMTLIFMVWNGGIDNAYTLGYFIEKSKL